MTNDIFFWDGVTTTRITNNTTPDHWPDISGSNVVWYGCDGGTGSICTGGDFEIYLWDGDGTTQITNNSTPDYSPAVSGSNVVWKAWDGDDYEIYLWDGATTTNLSNTGPEGDRIDDVDPAISGSNIVWAGWPSGGFYDGREIYLATPGPPVPSLSLPALSLLGVIVLVGAVWQIRSRRFSTRRP